MGVADVAGRRTKLGVALLTACLCMFSAGCRKKTPAPAPPPPVVTPKAEAPKAERPVVASFEAEPGAIERGQAATLRWSVRGETTDIRIEPGIGQINASGTRQVFPGNTTTYTLTATGPGGSATATASVNVTTPQPPPAVKPTQSRRSVSEILSQDVQDVFFDYDSSTIREDARAALSRSSDVLKSLFSEYPSANIVIEGHADERGSAEYNLGLADRRATAVKEFLTQLGVAGDRLRPQSYGKERPQCTESTEACWQQNRRAHFATGQ